MKQTLRRAALIAAACFGLAAGAADAPKYIFYYIGDGMGLGPVNATETYRRQVLGATEPLTMNTFEQLGWITTYSASAPVTDSAAAGTALATGHKTNNGMLGVTPDNTTVQSVAAELFARGWGVGLTTSVYPDDATPGAFYAHVPSRKHYYTIDCTMAECGYQFVGGAGLTGTATDGEPNDVWARLEANGVQVVRGPEGIDSIRSERVLLLNPEGSKTWNIGYTVDSLPGVLDLPLMARTCLRQLERTSPERFFMMVEGGNIDHALHANDGGAAIKEIINFNEAIQVAVDFYRQHPDETLIVVTADHDTGALSLLNRAKDGLKYIDSQRISKEEFNDYCKAILRSRRVFTWEDMKEFLNEKLGLFGAVPVSAEQEEELKEDFTKTFELRNSEDQETLYARFNEFAKDVFELFNTSAGLAFSTTGHSGNPVPVCALGVGADRFRGFMDNTDIPARIRSIAGLSE